MKLYLLFLLIAFQSISTACARLETSQNPQTSNTNSPATPSPSPSPTAPPDTELQKQLDEIAKTAKGKVGVAAVVFETGQRVSLNAADRYPMQSVYKVPIAMAVLKMVDDAKVRLGQQVNISPDDFVRQGFHSPIRNMNPGGAQMPVQEIMRYSISESDGTASDVLLDLAGGPAAVQAYLNGIDVENVIVANSEKEISRDWDTQYRNWATPEGAVELLRAIHERWGLSEDSTKLLLQYMTDTETGDRRLKAAMPEGASLAHKTGTGGTENGITGATNDIGIVTLPDGRHIAIAVFVSDSPADGPTREKVIADIAKAILEKWGQSPMPAKSPAEPVGNQIDFNTRHSL